MNQDSKHERGSHLRVNFAPETLASEAMKAKATTLTVTCPLTGATVMLQRCSFCERSEGLLFDPADNSLSLCCRPPSKAS